MKGFLHYPHPKNYCIHFQTKHGTLKGIVNSWDQVVEECCWENQQHGRGHHLKVVIKEPVKDTVFGLELIHSEDETPTPTFTTTKTGAKKATCLVGIDCREWRLGLSWAAVNQEGPRKWHPASNVKIKVVDGASTPGCEMEKGTDKLVLSVPAGKSIIIPIRIEVLSAVKGAGNFSKYSVRCFELESLQRSSPKQDGWVFKTPNILVEAKWLPAAPVRVQNKNRFSCSNAGGNGTTASGAKNGQRNKQNKQNQQQQHQQHFHLQDGTPTPVTNIEQFQTLCKSLSTFLANETSRLSDVQHSELDLSVQELQCSLASYCLRRARVVNPMLWQHQQGVISSSIAVIAEENKRKLESQQQQQQQEQEQSHYKRQKSSPEQEIPLSHNVLSSPPRGPRIAPISNELMTAISLPSSSIQQAPHRSCTINAKTEVTQTPQNKPFNAFDILADAAVKSSFIN